MKITTHHKHLGDLINIIQRLKFDEIFTSDYCPCCGNSVEKTVSDLLTILKLPIKLSNNNKNSNIVFPSWNNSNVSWIKEPYIKPHIIINKKNLISYQFDARSNRENKELKINDKKKFELKFPDAIDLGEKSGLSIIDKFEKICASHIYVGIDSGVTHLAMMTNTTCFVIHKEEYKVDRFYPDTPQIEFFSCLDKMINKINAYKIKMK